MEGQAGNFVRSSKFRGIFTFFAVFLAVGLYHAQGSADAPQWVGTWAGAPQLTEPKNMPPAPGLSSNTLRQVVHVSIAGKKLRVKFSNAFGTGPVEISSARIALSAGGGAINKSTDKPLTFSGNNSVTIPAGKMASSDTFDFDLLALADVAVTIHFGETPPDVTGHPGSRATSYVQAGDATDATDLPMAAKTQHWYILTGIDVVGDRSGAAVVTLGDSITDGRGSTTDGNNRWPDDLAARLQADPGLKNIAVLNQGIGGNCVVHGGLGPTALARFQRDVLDQSSVRWLIVLEGVNDIGGSRGTNSPVAQDLIAAFQKMIKQAHAANIRVYGATILPFGASFYDSPAHEEARQTVNNWIRTGGEFDAVIDFDVATRDPDKPARLLPSADSGDHLHPSVKGYEMMAQSIDPKLFAK